MPDLEITLQTSEYRYQFNLPPQSYLGNWTDVYEGVLYNCVNLIGNNTNGSEYILGRPFINSFYTELYFNNTDTPIALAVSSGAPAGTSITKTEIIEEDDGLGAWKIALIIIGSLLFVMFVGYLIFKCKANKAAKDNQQVEEAKNML